MPPENETTQRRPDLYKTYTITDAAGAEVTPDRLQPLMKVGADILDIADEQGWTVVEGYAIYDENGEMEQITEEDYEERYPLGEISDEEQAVRDAHAHFDEVSHVHAAECQTLPEFLELQDTFNAHVSAREAFSEAAARLDSAQAERDAYRALQKASAAYQESRNSE